MIAPEGGPPVSSPCQLSLSVKCHVIIICTAQAIVPTGPYRAVACVLIFLSHLLQLDQEGLKLPQKHPTTTTRELMISLS